MASDCQHPNPQSNGWHCTDCGLLFEHRPNTQHEAQFRRWWRNTPGFDRCTLRQALGAYAATFPGRVLPLLQELLGGSVDEHRNPQEEGSTCRGFFEHP